MSEEVTYADLKFQDSSETENIQEFDQDAVKGKILSYGCFVRALPGHVRKEKICKINESIKMYTVSRLFFFFFC